MNSYLRKKLYKYKHNKYLRFIYYSFKNNYGCGCFWFIKKPIKVNG